MSSYLIYSNLLNMIATEELDLKSEKGGPSSFHLCLLE